MGGKQSKGGDGGSDESGGSHSLDEIYETERHQLHHPSYVSSEGKNKVQKRTDVPNKLTLQGSTHSDSVLQNKKGDNQLAHVRFSEPNIPASSTELKPPKSKPMGSSGRQKSNQSLGSEASKTHVDKDDSKHELAQSTPIVSRTSLPASNIAEKSRSQGLNTSKAPLPLTSRSVEGNYEVSSSTVYPSIANSHGSRPVQKQRSAFTSSTSQVRNPVTSTLTSQKSDDDLLRKPKQGVKATSSLDKDWAPGSRSYSYSYTPRPETATLEKSAIPLIKKPTHSSFTEDSSSTTTRTTTAARTTTATISSKSDLESPKNKLVVKGLRSFVNSRRRNTHTGTTSAGESIYPGRPKLWSREFPMKGKFHPDKYIYDFEEGPKRPARPYSAMAKCKRHGGRCDNCGIFTCDLCQSCRKCEIDCSCPNKGKTVRSEYPYTCPSTVYSEMFGGDAWKKTCKVFCDLTENEKMHPVGGGNGNNDKKWNQVNRCTKRIDPMARNNMYQSQIDVLNPYKIPLENNDPCPTSPPPYMMPPTYPMCAMPPMYPMPYMPMMPPPMMPFCSPFYPPPVLPPPPPSYPYDNSFMPSQNLV